MERLRRARDLLSVTGYDTADTILACYSGTGFSSELKSLAATDRRVLLADLDRIYQR